MADEIINKVAQSPIITIDMKNYYPSKTEYEMLDIAHFLYEKLILKEKLFRQALKELDYTIFKDKYVGIYCSEDVIIPQWAYMLACVHLYPYASQIYFADEEALIQKILIDKIQKIDLQIYKDKPVVIKGCSDVKINMDVYLELIKKLMPIARSIMYGEPCSTVPLFKKSLKNE